MEIWKDVKGYEGSYQVSSLGRVKSLERYVKHSKGGLSVIKEIILKGEIDSHGYCRVRLSFNGKTKKFFNHRLVAVAFIVNSENKSQVNHINGITTDNRIDNLEWCTPKENTKHATETGLRNFKGDKSSLSKLSESNVIEIRNSQLSQRELAVKYNVHFSTIHLIVKRKNWKHI